MPGPVSVTDILLTSILAPASARAFNCCSVAYTGLSDCGGGEECWAIESSASAGVTDDVDLRGGMFVWYKLAMRYFFADRDRVRESGAIYRAPLSND